VAQLGGVTLQGTFNYANQTYQGVRPTGMAAGTYLMSFRKNGELLAATNIVLCACVPCATCDCPPGPQGPAGPAGRNGLNGTNGLNGVQGPAGPRGPQGPKGEKGAVGAVGPRGPAGPLGTNGINGTNGLTGPQGPAGPAGATGPAGTNGVNTTGGSSEFGYIYNLSAQVVPLETAVTFSDNGIGTPGITHAPGGADIGIVDAGIYKVTFSVSGTEPNQFALFLNGVMVPGSDYGSGAGTQQNNGQAILAIGANDILTLRNHTSAAAVTLAAAPPIGGTVQAVNASILLQRLN
jgi:hypothetical protein